MNKINCRCNNGFTTNPTGEYPCTVPGCIKPQVPSCPPAAVIPLITVDTTEGITNLSTCFVHVTEINTTFYIDDKHRMAIIWAGPVEVADYDTETNPLGLRSQDCYTTVDGVYSHVYFDMLGIAHILGKEEQ